jgi:hypothetical protein
MEGTHARIVSSAPSCLFLLPRSNYQKPPCGEREARPAGPPRLTFCHKITAGSRCDKLRRHAEAESASFATVDSWTCRSTTSALLLRASPRTFSLTSCGGSAKTNFFVAVVLCNAYSDREFHENRMKISHRQVHGGNPKFGDPLRLMFLRLRDHVDEFYFASKSTLFTGKSQWASRISNRRCSSFWNAS